MAVEAPSGEAMEAMIAKAKQPVFLNVYELGNTSSLVLGINKVTQDFLSQGGLFHTAIDVIGREVSFGATRRSGTGIFSCHPRRCLLHRYRESIYLGDCSKSPDQVKEIIRSLHDEWPGRKYSTLHRNCCHFAAELARRLGVGELPSWVHHLADVGAYLDDVSKAIAHIFEGPVLEAKDMNKDIGLYDTSDDPDIPECDHQLPYL